MRFALEIKASPVVPDAALLPESIVHAVKVAGFERRTTIVSFNWYALQAAQAIAPEIATGYLTTRQNEFDNIIGAADGGASPWTAGIRYGKHTHSD